MPRMPLILGLENALKRTATERTAKGHVDYLLGLGRWLFENSKQPIAGRLNDASLNDDVQQFIGDSDDWRVLTALNYLRASQSSGGVLPIAGRAELNAHPEDAALIKEYKKVVGTHTARTYATLLTDFSDYLRRNNKPAIAGRLHEHPCVKTSSATRRRSPAVTKASVPHWLICDIPQ
ncbi:MULTISPECIES: hypothetical protein [unclassified Bradyrhizobium]